MTTKDKQRIEEIRNEIINLKREKAMSDSFVERTILTTDIIKLQDEIRVINTKDNDNNT